MPDVELARRSGVELVRTGSWSASTGTWNPSRDDLAAAVAAMQCPAVRRPRIKLGHTDERFNGDGEPALGWFENLRTTDGGHALVADQVAVPWLNTVQAAAYPDRSIEGNYRHRCSLGHEHPFVITAVALLGVTPPAVSTLKSVQDLPDMLGVAAAQEVPDGAEQVHLTIRAADTDVVVPNVLLPVAAAEDNQLRTYWTKGEGAAKIRWNTPGDFDRCVRQLGRHVADPKGLCAEYHHDATGQWPAEHAHTMRAAEGAGPPARSRAERIREAWNASNPPLSQWVTEARTDAAVVVDDADRSYRLYPVTWNGDQPVFGQPQPYDPEADRPLVFASRAESRPDADADAAYEPDTGDIPPAEPEPADEPAPILPAAEPEPETPTKEDPVSLSDEMRSRLGLADDADETAALAAIDALKAKAETPAEPNADMVAASAAAKAENDELRKEVTVLASKLQEVTSEVAAAKAEKAATVKASVLDAAIRDGKITPAEREQWATDYDEAPAAVTRVLASIAVGTAVPVAASGVAGGPEPVLTDLDDDTLTEVFFGPGAAARFKNQEA